MRLEDGKYYRTRDGRKVGPMKHYGKVGLLKHYGMGDLFFECDGNLWFNDGGFEWDRESKNDIVAEWVDNDHIERTKRMIEVMQAYVDGKEIEFHSGANDSWSKTDMPIWDCFFDKYRIANKGKDMENRILNSCPDCRSLTMEVLEDGTFVCKNCNILWSVKYKKPYIENAERRR